MTRSADQRQQPRSVRGQIEPQVMTVNAPVGDQRLQVLIEGYGALGHSDRDVFQKRHPANQNQDASRFNQASPVIEPFASDFLHRIAQPEPLHVLGAQPGNFSVPEMWNLTAGRPAGSELYNLA